MSFSDQSFWVGFWEFIGHRTFCEIILIGHIVLFHIHLQEWRKEMQTGQQALFDLTAAIGGLKIEKSKNISAS